MATKPKTAPAPAAKKTAPTKTAAKGTALQPWEAEMAGRASKASKAIAVSSLTKKISTQGGILSVDDTPMEDNELRVIVIGYLPENQFYDKPFDPKNPAVPACYSFGNPEDDEPEAGMSPHEEAESPQGDDDGACKGCWANKMGSADIGRGKACKNIYRVAVVTEDSLESASALADAEVRTLNVPVMSVKNLATYIHKLGDDFQRPAESVVTLLKVVPDAKSQFQVKFSFEELINFDGELWEAMKLKVAEVQKQLLVPYPKQAELDASNSAKPMKPRGRAAQMMRKPGAKPAAKSGAKGAKF